MSHDQLPTKKNPITAIREGIVDFNPENGMALTYNSSTVMRPKTNQ
jgi:hypothetical protein